MADNYRILSERAQQPPWTDILSITDLGRAVLQGEVDFLSLRPPGRWVGGVKVGAGMPGWRWNEKIRDAVGRGGWE
jgi:hypothetical protein